MKISAFEWDEGNILHIALRRGTEPEEGEEVLAIAPLVRKTKRGHYAGFGPTLSGRLLVVVFAKKPRGVVRVITAWDMNARERRYYRGYRSV